MGIIVVVVIGLIAGLILSVASIVFAVPVNEKEEALVGVLPGANCGACGFAGCSGYAAALAEGSAELVSVLRVVRMLQQNVQKS